MPAAEPTLATLPNPALRYFLATRPPFLGVTLFACLIGLATAFASSVSIRTTTAIITIVFALMAHAGINVLNVYYDALNGADANNTERIFPFTGGSRFIQNGVLSLRETAVFGTALIAVVIAAGIWLTTVSAPPLKLNSRRMGEACVWTGFALIAVGTDFTAWQFRGTAASRGDRLRIAGDQHSFYQSIP